jgi:hypothetical protein
VAGVDRFIFHQVTTRPKILLTFDPVEWSFADGAFRFDPTVPATGPVIISPETLNRKRADIGTRYSLAYRPQPGGR